MMLVVGGEEARAIDRRVIEEVGIPSLVLMENAALSVLELIEARYPDAGEIAVLCGRGNNGGDGLAVARHLLTRGRVVSVVVCSDGHPLSADAEIQLAVLGACGVTPRVVGPADVDAVGTLCDRAALVVDALFGTGLSRPLEGWLAELVVRVAAGPARVVAVDLPTGLSADGGEELGTTLPAEATVTFFAPKWGLILSPGSEVAGDVYVTSLGVPAASLRPPGESPEGAADTVELISSRSLHLPERPEGGHKGTFGHLLAVAGSPGKSGAASLAARGALRSGVGLVTVATPAGCAAEVDAGCLEAMTLALPSSGGLLEEPAARVLSATAGKAALALGPGLGDDELTGAWIRELALAARLPAVLDADALNAFARRAGELAGRPAPTILTPHPGEIARLLEVETPRTTAERVRAALSLAAMSRSIVVLKGRQTLVADPAGRLRINPTGNPGMGTAGSGDVLTGVVGALLASGLEPVEAATAGVYLHGLAGDLTAAALGREAMMAGDIVERLPAAWRMVRRARSRPAIGQLRPVGETEVAELVAAAGLRS